MKPAMRRLLWETGCGVLAVVVVFGVWEYQGWRADQGVARLVAEHETELAQRTQEAETWAAELAYQQAELVFQRHVFKELELLIRGDLEAQREADIHAAIDLLIRLEPVLFVHVLSPGGEVLGTTDRKLEITGRADERAHWALEASDVVVRVGADDLTEIAGPITTGEGGETLAVLWLGYDGSGLGARLGAGE